MTATNHTENYNLSQFVGTDRPTWRGDYNGDMMKIDAQMKQNADDIASATAGGLTSVSHTADLTGNGTSGSPLGVADTIARKADIPDTSGFATTESVTQAIASAIADRLTAGDIKPGNGINIETSGNQVTISYVGDGSSGGLSAVAHDTTLTGNGTANMPLGVAPGVVTLKFPRDIDDCDKITTTGVYLCQKKMSNTPYGSVNITMVLYVYLLDADLLQLAYVTWNGSKQVGEIFIRSKTRWTPSFDQWMKFATMGDVPDVSALTPRIAALESQVAALTNAAIPDVTGLTAAELDTQYLDNYNIVRVGTPTHNTESEEPSQ